jgi:hypothetical protein
VLDDMDAGHSVLSLGHSLKEQIDVLAQVAESAKVTQIFTQSVSEETMLDAIVRFWYDELTGTWAFGNGHRSQFLMILHSLMKSRGLSSLRTLYHSAEK